MQTTVDWGFEHATMVLGHHADHLRSIVGLWRRASPDAFTEDQLRMTEVFLHCMTAHQLRERILLGRMEFQVIEIGDGWHALELGFERFRNVKVRIGRRLTIVDVHETADRLWAELKKLARS